MWGPHCVTEENSCDNLNRKFQILSVRDLASSKKKKIFCFRDRENSKAIASTRVGRFRTETVFLYGPTDICFISIEYECIILTEGGPLRAVDVQRQIAFLLRRTVIVEHLAVRAQFLRDFVVRTLVVLVALVGVREEPVRFRALALQLQLGTGGFFVVVLDHRWCPPRRHGRCGRRPSPTAVRRLAAQQSDCGKRRRVYG